VTTCSVLQWFHIVQLSLLVSKKTHEDTFVSNKQAEHILTLRAKKVQWFVKQPFCGSLSVPAQLKCYRTVHNKTEQQQLSAFREKKTRRGRSSKQQMICDVITKTTWGAEPWKYSWEPVPPPPTLSRALSDNVTLLPSENREGHVQQINILSLTATGYTIWREKSLTLFSGEVRSFAPWVRSCFIWWGSRRFFMICAVIRLRDGKRRNRSSILGWGKRHFSHYAQLGSGAFCSLDAVGYFPGSEGGGAWSSPHIPIWRQS